MRRALSTRFDTAAGSRAFRRQRRVARVLVPPADSTIATVPSGAPCRLKTWPAGATWTPAIAHNLLTAQRTDAYFPSNPFQDFFLLVGAGSDVLRNPLAAHRRIFGPALCDLLLTTRSVNPWQQRLNRPMPRASAPVPNEVVKEGMHQAPMPSLFDPVELGAIQLPNRIIMAPLTRGRATRDHVPTPVMVRYYAQRATAGVIITEATGISQQGLGWPYAPGIWSRDQITAWRTITHAVHEAGGRIILQLWHMGRVVHPSFLGGEKPVSASATTAPDFAHTYTGKQPYVEARPLAPSEIGELIQDYRGAAKNAMTAGFDGIQIHAANGYLIDQFLRDKTNLRDDDFGGTVQRRIRLLHDVVAAVAGAIGPGRTGVRLSPNEEVQGVRDSTPEILFTAVARMLSDLGVAHLELREPGENSTFQTAERPPIAPLIRKAFTGKLILNSGYDVQSGQRALDSGAADAISFGRPFIANPDLPRRLTQHIPLRQEKMSDWYGPAEAGYADYPDADTPAVLYNTAEAGPV